MAFAPEDLRIDYIRSVGGACVVRATHVPTGLSVTADQGADARENRDLALARLAEAVDGGGA